MNTTTTLFIFVFTSLLVSCNKNNKEEVTPLTDASFTYSLSSPGVAPCMLYLKASKENAFYSWTFNNSPLRNSKEASVEIKEEGYYPVALRVANGSASDTKKDTITVYAEEYGKSVKLPDENVDCKSFQYKGKSFSFNDLDNNGIHFNDIPYFFPDDIGTTLYQLSSSSDKKIRSTTTGTSESGSSILYFDTMLKTEKVDISEKMKVYIFYTSDCLDSVKVYDYLP